MNLPSVFPRCALMAAAIVAAAAPRAVAAQNVAGSARADTLRVAGSTALSLGDAIRFAARNSAAARVLRLRVTEADARARQQRAALLPTLATSASANQHTLNSASFGFSFPLPPGQPPVLDPDGQIIGPVNTLDVRARLTQQLLDPGAIGRVRAARALTRSTSAEADVGAARAGAAAADAYLRAMRATADVAARTADSLVAADLLGIARDQLQAGVGVALDVTRAAARVAATRAQLIASRNQRDRTRIDLLRTLGLPAGASITLADSLSAPPSDTAVDEAAALRSALANRPDVRAEDARVSAARSAISAVRAERLPSVGLVADDGANGKAPTKLLNTYSVGVQLSLPVFDGLRRAGRQQEQEALLNEAEVRRDDTRAQAEADVRTAVLDLASAREQVDAARERLRLGEQEVAQARERFRAGVAGNADVIAAALALTGARTALLDALAGYESARVAFARAQGTLVQLP